MNLYRNSIIVFGYVLPGIVALLVLGLSLFAKQKVQTSFDEKVSHFKGFKQNRVAVMTMEKEITQKRAVSSHWEELLNKETASAVTSNLRQISDKLPSKEFQITSQSTPPSKAGFGSVSAQKSTQVNLGCRATFRSMQKALLELETRMPQLQLQELRITPANSSGNLNFDVAYTAWAP
ncbi:hypothetical protein [Haloferula sargassicola]|uniref:Uncharacterized protein n=1 Tax=Haloferula sargassicola TaxID=490096 RepID=A0ABP9UST2_9BACT